MTGTQDSKKFDYQMSYNFKEKQKVLNTTFSWFTLTVANIVTRHATVNSSCFSKMWSL